MLGKKQRAFPKQKPGLSRRLRTSKEDIKIKIGRWKMAPNKLYRKESIILAPIEFDLKKAEERKSYSWPLEERSPLLEGKLEKRKPAHQSAKKLPHEVSSSHRRRRVSTLLIQMCAQGLPAGSVCSVFWKAPGTIEPSPVSACHTMNGSDESEKV